jgi:glutathione peroxidase
MSEMSVYDFKVKTINDKEVSLSDYKGKLLLIVNTASKCGFTPQYEGLEALYKKYKDRGLVILGFPCNQFLEQDPGTNEQISSFCKVNFGVTFPLFAKIDVNGPKEDPLYRHLKDAAPFRGFETEKESGRKIQDVVRRHYPENLKGDGIKWNFTKFLVSRDGAEVRRFEPTFTPQELDAVVAEALKA